ncbi:formimidoylglutamase [Adhaeribacter sp. BT258]|uniref:Formimidoylglutamase n=1 Tax=Adhaeribacter terrigena TaxID=2793070 RepID=A0ABS1C1D7_9BACT|nr:formimidoylglutamase [Adhaeribacter terrigena]MBK0402982.1 formimidoylglutamase [Adhaeribacter terrigena]
MEKHWSLIGLPDDTGVKNVNGRMGAAGGPAAFRTYFEKLRGNADVKKYLRDCGDVQTQISIEETHRSAANCIADARLQSHFTVVLGGGHDLVFPHLQAYKNGRDLNKKTGCINIDVHLDLRPDKPVITSGSPFYMALESGILEGANFVEFGIQEYANAEELFVFAGTHHVNIVKFDDLRNGHAVSGFKKALQYLTERCDEIVISLDMDAFQAAFAPGVSAPAPEGFTPSEVVEMLRYAAENEKVTSLGIYELNPEFDLDDRTARLAAVCAYQFASQKLANHIAL